MPLSGCSNGLVVTALVIVCLLPARYYVPDSFSPESQEPQQFDFDKTWWSIDLPPWDLLVTLTFIVLAAIIYVRCWIIEKLMDRRILKLNQDLQDCVEQLRSWDARQEELEATLKMVQNAISEYNLLLYLLKRHHHLGPVTRKPTDGLPQDTF